MSNTSTAVAPMQQIKTFLEGDKIKAKFQELLGAKSAGFITGVLQVVNSNSLLQKASPNTIYNAAATAAILDLPINNNLGFAYIVPYGSDAQFQIGYKGLIQLALRTGKYKAINAIPVFANQFKSFNYMTEEFECDFQTMGTGDAIGYAAYFKLINGFEKTVYMTREQVEKHGKRRSKSFNNGPWKSDFDAMACKTVLKMALKFGPLSIEMERAVVADQAVIRDVETNDVEYVDVPQDATSVDELPTDFVQMVQGMNSEADADLIEATFPAEFDSDAGKRLVQSKLMQLNLSKK